MLIASILFNEKENSGPNFLIVPFMEPEKITSRSLPSASRLQRVYKKISSQEDLPRTNGPLVNPAEYPILLEVTLNVLVRQLGIGKSVAVVVVFGKHLQAVLFLVTYPL